VTDALSALSAALADRYRLERELGQGGMATVYLAQDLKHDRAVALKVLKPELAHALGPERFLREIQVTAQLDHPHILPLLDSGDAGGFLYYVMPYVQGETLRTRLTREKQLPLDDALQIAAEVADALNYAHGQGIVHRDIKPENLLLAGRHIRVTDFGIARAVTAAGGDSLTATGVAIGTPAYMSPEQAGGSKDLDGRSDLYSLGCVLYEMLAGHPPFTGGTAHEILARHSMDAVPSLAAARPTLPEGLERAIATALAKVPADRFSTAAQFADALARRGSSATVGAARSSRRVARLAVIAVAGMVTVGGAILMLRPSPKAPGYARTAIAVLPFQNLSAQGPHAYFAGGLQDELLTQLSKVAALKVISRTSVMGYEGTKTPLRQIASELGVGSVVEGSVQVIDGRLRVNVELIDAATDGQIWAERYDRKLVDAFGIQSDVAQQIVTAVGAALSGAEQQRLAAAPTANAEAYQAYLQGREYSTRPGFVGQNYEIGQQLFERALALDSGFALAHAALSQVHGRLYSLRLDPSPARFARQREEAEAALRLAPSLPQAHLAMAGVYRAQYDLQLELGELAIALKGLPADAELWSLAGAVHRRLGKWSEAIMEYQKAARLDPRNANLFYALGTSFTWTRRYAEAVRAYDRALSLAPDFHIAAVVRGWTYVHWEGQLDTLRLVLRRLPSDAPLASYGTRGAHDVQLLYWQRQPDSLLRVLLASRAEAFDGQPFFWPKSLYAAWAHRLRGDRLLARAAFDSALVLVDSVLKKLPDDWRVHAARGLVLAGLGRGDEARREARWLEQSVVYRADAFFGAVCAEARARVLAQVGDADAALDQIDRLLTKPAFFSIHSIQLDPLYDPIRDHPRFKALLAKYAER